MVGTLASVCIWLGTFDDISGETVHLAVSKHSSFLNVDAGICICGPEIPPFSLYSLSMFCKYCYNNIITLETLVNVSKCW